MSLNSLGNLQWLAGRREEALDALQEAVETYTRLTTRNSAVFAGHLRVVVSTFSEKLESKGLDPKLNEVLVGAWATLSESA